MKPNPTSKDKRLLRSTADRVWEWAKQAEDEGTREALKQMSSRLHELAR